MAVALLEPADAVLEAGGAGDRPRAGQGLGVALVGPELGVVARAVVLLGGEGRVDDRQLVDGSGMRHGSEPLAR